MNVIDRIAHLPTEDNVTVPGGGTLDDVPRPPGPVIIYNANILGDLDEDSDVDFKDYSIFANQWLDSGNSNPLKVTASDGSTGDWFGFSVAVDADYAIIGAPRDNSHNGAAYIFEYNDGNWTQQAKLTASDGAAGDYFGSSVSISANHAIVGAAGDDDYTGSAYIFEYNDGNWTQQAKLTAYLMTMPKTGSASPFLSAAIVLSSGPGSMIQLEQTPARLIYSIATKVAQTIGASRPG